MRCSLFCLIMVCAGLARAEPLPPSTQQQLEQAANAQPDRGISANEPVYFIVGGGLEGDSHVTAKFQFSLKYRVLNPESLKVEEQRWWEQIYVGYTQSSIWDLEADSAPFKDTSYRPSVFYDHQSLAGFSERKSLLGLRLGLEHESNGKDGDSSRSINTVFFRPTYSFPATADGYFWSLVPKLYAYIEKSDNSDIPDYRGYGDFVLKLAKPDSWEFATVLRKGMKGSKGSLELDATYPLKGFLSNINGALHMQFFYGYGETILDYEKKQPAQLRLGLIIVR